VPHKDPEKRREFLQKWRVANREKIREASQKISTRSGRRTVPTGKPIASRFAHSSASMRLRSERRPKNAAILVRRTPEHRDELLRWRAPADAGGVRGFGPMDAASITGATLAADGGVALSFGEAAKSNGNALEEWMAGRHENSTQRN
jgi:hypothetical protein